MIPQTVRTWLAGYYAEAELRARVPGSRQNWTQRRARLRAVAGVELLPGVWVYERRAADAWLAETAKFRPGC